MNDEIGLAMNAMANAKVVGRTICPWSCSDLDYKTRPDHTAGVLPAHHARKTSYILKTRFFHCYTLQENGKTERENYQSICLVSHTGKTDLKGAVRRLSNHREAKQLLPEDQTTHNMFVLRRLHEIG